MQNVLTELKNGSFVLCDSVEIYMVGLAKSSDVVQGSRIVLHLKSCIFRISDSEARKSNKQTWRPLLRSKLQLKR